MSIFEKPDVVNEEYRPLFGRAILMAYSDGIDLDSNRVKQILTDVLPTHYRNMQDIQYLQGYLVGNQKILSKVKLVREEINNKVLENNCFHVIEFKKGFEFGNPIQYVQHSDGETKTEIDTLNKYMIANDKASKDIDISEDFFVSGTSYRYVRPSKEIDAPFEVFNVDPKQAGVVYSTDIDRKALLGFYLVSRTEMKNGEENEYYVITAYTKNRVFVYRADKDGTNWVLTYIPDKPELESHILGDIPIVEYPLNKNRLGLVELIMSTLDSLNKISSNDIDDIEQFVQALIVLVNADVDLDTLAKAKQAGVMLVKDSNAQFKADIKSIVNKLLHSETKILYDRLYNNMLTIAGVPRMSDKVSSGDTGQARLVGEGWTMADERAKQDELSFKVAEKKLLKLILNICKATKNSDIKTLMPSDIEIKFTRNKSDNMLVKAQALINLMTAQVDPEVAFRTVELWSDPAEVLRQSLAFFGAENFWKAIKTEMSNQNTVKQEQEGEVENTIGVNAQ